jgi:hypothetical protein
VGFPRAAQVSASGGQLEAGADVHAPRILIHQSPDNDRLVDCEIGDYHFHNFRKNVSHKNKERRSQEQ